MLLPWLSLLLFLLKITTTLSAKGPKKQSYGCFDMYPNSELNCAQPMYHTKGATIQSCSSECKNRPDCLSVNFHAYGGSCELYQTTGQLTFSEIGQTKCDLGANVCKSRATAYLQKNGNCRAGDLVTPGPTGYENAGTNGYVSTSAYVQASNSFAATIHGDKPTYAKTVKFLPLTEATVASFEPTAPPATVAVNSPIETIPPVTDRKTEATVPPVTESQTFPVIPTEPRIIPTESRTVPTESQTAPTVSRTLPTEPQTAPTVSRTLPTEPQTAPTVSRTLPTEPQTAPTVSRTLPTEPQTAPTVSWTLPTEPQTAPTESWTLATDLRTISTEPRTLATVRQPATVVIITAAETPTRNPPVVETITVQQELPNTERPHTAPAIPETYAPSVYPNTEVTRTFTYDTAPTVELLSTKSPKRSQPETPFPDFGGTVVPTAGGSAQGTVCGSGELVKFLRINGTQMLGLSDATFTAASEQDCLDACKQNELPNSQKTPCTSVNFNVKSLECGLNVNSLIPTGSGIPTDNPSAVYFEKLCIKGRLLDALGIRDVFNGKLVPSDDANSKVNPAINRVIPSRVLEISRKRQQRAKLLSSRQ